MGCCNGSVIVLIVCTLQLITIVERLIVDFIGFLYLSIIPGFVQIVIVIIAIFGLCLYKHKLIVVYLVWSVIFIAWNIFVICIYLQVGTFDEESYSILSFSVGKVSEWIKLTRSCEDNNNCAIYGNAIEVIHAAIQVLLSLIGCVSSAYVIYLLREKDDTSPIFQVYKAPSSRRSSISLRLDRENTLSRPEHWETPNNGRDSIRSNRSTRSTRSTRARQSNTATTELTNTDNGTRERDSNNRQSKRSNRDRGSTRSRSKGSHSRGSAHQNGSAKNRPHSLPWEPTIAPSSGVDSDVPETPTELQPPRNQHNPAYGYTSSESPYMDYSQHQRGHQGISPGPPPGPAPPGNRVGGYRPTNLSQSFNAVADLPPPLDEGPEAYSRDSVAFPAPPPPLHDGPGPYMGNRKEGHTNPTYQQSPVHQQLPSLSLAPQTPTKEPLSSSSAPSSPGGSSISTEKDPSAFRSSNTLEQNLDRNQYQNKYTPRQPPVGHVYDSRNRDPVNRQPIPSQQPARDRNGVNNLRATTNRPDLGPSLRPPDVSPVRPLSGVSERTEDSSPYANHQRPLSRGQLNDDNSRKPPALHLPAKQPYKQPEPSPAPSSDRTTPPRSGYPSDFDDIPQQRMVNQTSPTADLRQMRNPNSQPKDNTFKRMVTGNLSRPSNDSNMQVNDAASRPSPGPQINMQYNAQAPVGRQTGQQQTTPQSQPNRYQPPQRQTPAQPTYKPQTPAQQVYSPQSHVREQPKPVLYNDRSPTNRPPPTSNGHHMNNHQKTDSVYINKPPEASHQQHNNSRPMPNNNRQAAVQSVSDVRPSQTRNPVTGALTEVTSSYGGLYSSRQTAAPRPRPQNTNQSSNYAPHPGLTNATDEMKTTKGPFISARPSVI